MKVTDLVAELQKYDPETEVWFTSCCYPETKWVYLDLCDDGDLLLCGYEGSFVAGDPEESPR